MTTADEAEACIAALNGQVFEGKSLTVAHVGYLTIFRFWMLILSLRRAEDEPELLLLVDTTESRSTLDLEAVTAAVDTIDHTCLDRTIHDTPTEDLLQGITVSLPALPTGTPSLTTVLDDRRDDYRRDYRPRDDYYDRRGGDDGRGGGGGGGGRRHDDYDRRDTR